MKRATIIVGMCLLPACSQKNNLLMGRVEGTVGSHTVVVTDCYRTSVPEPQRVSGEGEAAVWRYTPCRDADIWIRADQLTVNGRGYGVLNRADGVLVDHGVVSIQRHGASNQAAPRVANRAARISSIANRRILRVRQSSSWRKASRRFKKCTSWANRVISALSVPAGRPA